MDQSVLNESLESFHHTELGQKRQATIRWSKYSIWFSSSHLSYKPVNQDSSPNNMPYFIWKHIRLNVNNEHTFMTCAAQFKDIFQKYLRFAFGVLFSRQSSFLENSRSDQECKFGITNGICCSIL